MMWAIETESLGKSYGSVRAVDALSLRVAPGEIYAFLGLNGAGKSTTIRMLLGMIQPTSGSATVLGRRISMGRQEPWAEVGYLVESHSYPELTVTENLEIARRLHPGTPASAVGDVIARLGLSPYASRRTRTLSQGNRQRLSLAKALIHRPKLLFLDEPINGLDPAGIVEIRELLRHLAHQEGVTLFMSSHILAEVSRLAQRIGIIHQGRLLQELSIEALEQNRRHRLLVQSRDPALAHDTLREAGYVADCLSDGTLALTSAEALEQPDAVSRVLVEGGAPPTSLLIEKEELEPYFLRLIGMEGSDD